MYPNLTTAHMRDDVERRLLAAKANRQWMFEEGVVASKRPTLAMRARRRIATLLVSVGEWLDDQPQPDFPARLDKSLHPAPKGHQ